MRLSLNLRAFSLYVYTSVSVACYFAFSKALASSRCFWSVGNA